MLEEIVRLSLLLSFIVFRVQSLVIVNHNDLSLVKLSDRTFRLSVKVQNTTKTFNLQRRQENMQTLIADEDESLSPIQKSTETLFEDHNQDASVIIEKDESSSFFKISGVLGPELVIRPVKGEDLNNNDSDCDNCLKLSRHNVSSRHNEDRNTGAQHDDYLEVANDYRMSRQGKSLKNGKVYPEILVIVDYNLFKEFSFSIPKARKYIISYFNAVNMRFKTFYQPKNELNIAGVIFGKSKSSFPFISSALSNGDMLDAPASLHAMGQYYYKDRSNLPRFDMVVTLTGLDMARMKKGKMSRSNTGYAYIGGACVRNTYLKKISSVALVEDSGGYSGVVVTAHEIGHLLGAVHDGDSAPSYLRGPGAKSCPWSAGYIMSDLRHTSRGQLWSDCSVKQIKYFLQTTTAGCLFNSPVSSSGQYSLPGDKILPGTSISLDDQCRKDRGTRACYHDQRVCAQLFCYTSNYSGCYAYRPAVEGSSCGSNKICINGKCVGKSGNQEKKTVKYSTSRKPKLAQLNKKKC